MKTTAKILLVLVIILSSCHRHNSTNIGREYTLNYLWSIESNAYFFMDAYNEGQDLTEYYSQIDDSTWRKDYVNNDDKERPTGNIIFKRCSYNNTLVVSADIQEPDDEFMTYIKTTEPLICDFITNGNRRDYSDLFYAGVLSICVKADGIPDCKTELNLSKQTLP